MTSFITCQDNVQAILNLKDRGLLMRPIGTPEQLEKRRLKAVRLVIDKGYSAAEAAAATGQ